MSCSNLSTRWGRVGLHDEITSSQGHCIWEQAVINLVVPMEGILGNLVNTLIYRHCSLLLGLTHSERGDFQDSIENFSL